MIDRPVRIRETVGMSEMPKPQRRLYQFSLRALLVVFLLVSIFFAMFGTRLKKVARNRQAEATVRRVEAGVAAMGGRTNCVRRFGCDRLNEFLGDPGDWYVRQIYGGRRFSDAGMTYVAEARGLEELLLRRSQVTDAGMESVAELTCLELLWPSRLITDDGLESLQRLTGLKTLLLSSTQVSDAGLAHLTGLANLELLYLNDTQVTDAGLEHLKELTDLKLVDARGTGVTAEGAAMLREALPSCTVEYGD